MFVIYYRHARLQRLYSLSSQLCVFVRVDTFESCGFKGIVVPVLGMRACSESSGVAVLILNRDTRWKVINYIHWQLYSCSESLAATEQEARWILKLVSLFWRGETSLFPARNKTLDCPVQSLVTRPTPLTWLPIRIVSARLHFLYVDEDCCRVLWVHVPLCTLICLV